MQQQFESEESRIAEERYFVQACSVLGRLSRPEYISSKWRCIIFLSTKTNIIYLHKDIPSRLSVLLVTAQNMLGYCVITSLQNKDTKGCCTE